MFEAERIVKVRGQNYERFWKEVCISDGAKALLNSYSVQYIAFPRAFQHALLHLLQGPESTSEIQVIEVTPIDDVPEGIKISYTFTEGALLIAGMSAPVQLPLFGVQPTGKKSRRS